VDCPDDCSAGAPARGDAAVGGDGRGAPCLTGCPCRRQSP
jgi:hypothetical protein